MKHFASPKFWKCYDDLPTGIRDLADKNFALLKENRLHPSLHFKRIGTLWSARVGLKYRALGLAKNEDVVWFWIGTHAQYDRLIEDK